MKKKGTAPFIAAVLAVVLLACAQAAAEEIVLLSGVNRAAMEEAVGRLQQTELHRINRGRLKPNPVLFPYHTIYQTVMQDQEFLLGQQTAAYRNSLLRLHKTLADYPAMKSSGGRDVPAFFKSELISLYSIREELEDAESILDVWNTLKESAMGMDMLPLRAGLAMNALSWLDRYYEGHIPPEVLVRFDAISGDAPRPGNIFQAEAYLRELSEQYSRLFLFVVSGGENATPQTEGEPGE